MSNIHACPALDRLVAAKVMGWMYREGARTWWQWIYPDAAGVWPDGYKPLPEEEAVGRGMGWVCNAVDLPRWSSDPGEALNLLAEENQKGACFCLLYDDDGAYASVSDGVQTIPAQPLVDHLDFSFRVEPDAWFPDIALAITVGVLLQFVTLEDIVKACAGEEACRG